MTRSIASPGKPANLGEAPTGNRVAPTDGGPKS